MGAQFLPDERFDVSAGEALAAQDHLAWAYRVAVGLQQRLGDLTLSDLRVGQTPDDGHPLGGGDQVEPDSSEEAAHARGAGTIVSAAALTSADQETARVPAARDRVVSLTERRLVDARDGRTAEVILPADGRPLPSVATYDELLAHPSAAGTRGAS